MCLRGKGKRDAGELAADGEHLRPVRNARRDHAHELRNACAGSNPALVHTDERPPRHAREPDVGVEVRPSVRTGLPAPDGAHQPVHGYFRWYPDTRRVEISGRNVEGLPECDAHTRTVPGMIPDMYSQELQIRTGSREVVHDLTDACARFLSEADAAD